jgi:molecular chaperone GrpE
VELTRQKLLALLKAQGVEPLDTLQQPYDPHLAEAVAVEPVEPARDNVVLEELQRGYRLGDSILRPARVKVGKTRTGSC